MITPVGNGEQATQVLIDDWLYAHHRTGVGLSDVDHLLLVLSLGTTDGDVRKLVKGLHELSRAVAKGTASLLPMRAYLALPRSARQN